MFTEEFAKKSRNLAIEVESCECFVNNVIDLLMMHDHTTV